MKILKNFPPPKRATCMKLYEPWLKQLKPGDCFMVPNFIVARAVWRTAKKLNLKVITRKINRQGVGIWLAEP